MTRRERETSADVIAVLRSATAEVLDRTPPRSVGSAGPTGEDIPGGSTPAVRPSGRPAGDGSSERGVSGGRAGRDKQPPSPYDAALRLLGVRARSRSELRKRLLDKEFAAADVDEVLERLTRQQLLDDGDFADEWVRSRHLYSGKGRTALRHELRDKGVDDSVIANALSQIDDDSERSQAAALVDRKIGSVDPDALADRETRDKHLRRLVAMLARRGYGGSMAFDVAREAIDQRRGLV
ncbi:regulatory protein RecX [Jongsikchunia kroppenstedtii]|uniref:regulatory protein RecX n=1 Tax=Jongsikchunia kroppenstedtii TaxID=1121721 RepID=UPI00037A9727|nr:regulatory protein RecX [Jongsikchunia kroppenstedtii]